MAVSIRAIRGATTVDSDTPEQLIERMGEMWDAIIERNGVVEDDVIEAHITATADIHSMFPAQALREARDLKDVQLLGAQEIDVKGALAFALRMMVTVETDLAKSQIQHVYLHGAKSLRPDLAR